MRLNRLCLVCFDCCLVIKMAEKMKECFNCVPGLILLFGMKRDVRLFGLEGSLFVLLGGHLDGRRKTRQHFSFVPAGLQFGL